MLASDTAVTTTTARDSGRRIFISFPPLGDDLRPTFSNARHDCNAPTDVPMPHRAAQKRDDSSEPAYESPQWVSRKSGDGPMDALTAVSKGRKGMKTLIVTLFAVASLVLAGLASAGSESSNASPVRGCPWRVRRCQRRLRLARPARRDAGIPRRRSRPGSRERPATTTRTPPVTTDRERNAEGAGNTGSLLCVPTKSLQIGRFADIQRFESARRLEASLQAAFSLPLPLP